MKHDRKPWAHLYGSRWRRLRLQFLMQHPLCVMCKQEGRVIRSEVVDHVIPHRGDLGLFWDSENNWQALCASHHNRDKQSLEKGGRGKQAIGPEGWPL